MKARGEEIALDNTALGFVARQTVRFTEIESPNRPVTVVCYLREDTPAGLPTAAYIGQPERRDVDDIRSYDGFVFEIKNTGTVQYIQCLPPARIQLPLGLTKVSFACSDGTNAPHPRAIVGVRWWEAQREFEELTPPVRWQDFIPSTGVSATVRVPPQTQYYRIQSRNDGTGPTTFSVGSAYEGAIGDSVLLDVGADTGIRPLPPGARIVSGGGAVGEHSANVFYYGA